MSTPPAVPVPERRLRWAAQRLEAADLSLTCRRDSFCALCFHAYCHHCCDGHHHSSSHPCQSGLCGDHAFPVTLDGRPDLPGAVAAQLLGEIGPVGLLMDLVANNDYVTRHPRDSFCLRCGEAFSAAVCSHHHFDCSPAAVVRIEAARCVRCTGHEWWFPYLESILGDPVEEEEDNGGEEGQQLLLPVLTTTPGSCKHCGGENGGGWIENGSWNRTHCSPACLGSHRAAIAQRKQRREAMLAAREMADKLKLEDDASL